LFRVTPGRHARHAWLHGAGDVDWQWFRHDELKQGTTNVTKVATNQFFKVIRTSLAAYDPVK